MAGTIQSPEDYGVGRLFWLTQDAIVAADLSTLSIVLWNPAASAIFGWAEAEALGMPLERLVPQELQGQHQAGVSRFRDTGEARLVGKHPVEIEAMTKSGRRIDVSLTLTALDEERKIVLAIVRDISPQKRVERQLIDMNKAMESFVATASHELRTPLTSALGFAQILVERDQALTPSQRHVYAEAIFRAADRASRLVNDLLTVSKMQAGVLQTRPEEVIVQDAIREALGDQGPTFDQRIEDSLSVWVDPDHMQRILTNYISNVLKYGAPPFVIEASRVEDEVIILVSDGGPGVAKEFQHQLFTPFSRDAQSADGTGLGLSIVKGLAEANRGEAFYRKANPTGAVFGIRLPARSDG